MKNLPRPSVTVVVDNSVSTTAIKAQWGLSLLIRPEKGGQYLLDSGPGPVVHGKPYYERLEPVDGVREVAPGLSGHQHQA